MMTVQSDKRVWKLSQKRPSLVSRDWRIFNYMGL